ncbi:MAG: hypothetical protein ACLTE2_09325 [Eubacteriales bacterium]
MWEHVYPFSAIVGQDAMKKSLLLNIINPQIGGVLICGQKGTAKSTVVRSLANLSNCNVVNVPVVCYGGQIGWFDRLGANA